MEREGFVPIRDQIYLGDLGSGSAKSLRSGKGLRAMHGFFSPCDRAFLYVTWCGAHLK